MKPVKSILKKVRARNGTDIFYTYSNWETKEIDGVTFIKVVKSPDPIHLIKNDPKQIHWMKKDNMEYVK